MDRREQNKKWWSRFDSKRMVFVIEMGDGDEKEIPAEYQVCDVCDGKGTHVNPGIDSHGLSREDFDADPDFAEDYFSGAYDVTCNNCNGRNVEPVVAWERLDPDTRKIVEEFIDDHYAYQRECEAERRYGC